MYTTGVKLFDNYFNYNGNSLLMMCDSPSEAVNKTIVFPEGYDYTETNTTFKVCFKNGYTNYDAPNKLMTLNDKKIYVNKKGELIQFMLSFYTFTKRLNENTILEFYYDETLDDNNGGFVIVGNPEILSQDSVSVFADGTRKVFTISRIVEGSWSTTGPVTTSANFLSYDYIMPVLCTWRSDNGSEQTLTALIPRNEVLISILKLDSISTSPGKSFVFAGAAHSDTRMIAFSIDSADTFRIGQLSGESSHMPRFYGFYGIRMNYTMLQ